jgi:hypothetical protein
VRRQSPVHENDNKGGLTDGAGRQGEKNGYKYMVPTQHPLRKSRHHHPQPLNPVAVLVSAGPSLSYCQRHSKTKLVKRELCTVFLDTDGASDNRDDLTKTLYSLLFPWLNEHINQCLCCDDFDTFIGLFDLPT